jgi:DNA-binding CsgD family transcriptional regulator
VSSEVCVQGEPRLPVRLGRSGRCSCVIRRLPDGAELGGFPILEAMSFQRLTDDFNEDGTGVAPNSLPLALAVFLVLVVVGGTVDLILDGPTTPWSWHVAFEVALIAISLAFSITLFVGWRRTTTALRATRLSLEVTRRNLTERAAERDAWRARATAAVRQLSVAIDEQFDAWRLTPAERDVALRLLKGDGHKQAAAGLGRAERTVRQQAVEVYRKAGLQGRAELAAFFLHDLGGVVSGE